MFSVMQTGAGERGGGVASSSSWCVFNADLSPRQIVKCNVLRITLIAQFILYSVHEGASMVKWIANPCLMLSESDSKLYTNFVFL